MRDNADKNADNADNDADNAENYADNIGHEFKSRPIVSDDDDDEELKAQERAHLRRRPAYADQQVEVQETPFIDDDWGHSFEECKPGVFAAVHSSWDTGKGLSITRVPGGGGGGGNISDCGQTANPTPPLPPPSLRPGGGGGGRFFPVLVLLFRRFPPNPPPLPPPPPLEPNYRKTLSSDQTLVLYSLSLFFLFPFLFFFHVEVQAAVNREHQTFTGTEYVSQIKSTDPRCIQRYTFLVRPVVTSFVGVIGFATLRQQKTA